MRSFPGIACCALCVIVTTAGSAFAQSKVEYVVQHPNGSRSSARPFSDGGRDASFGSSVQLRPIEKCLCRADLIAVRVDGEARDMSPIQLPVTFTSGPQLTGSLTVARPASVLFRVRVTPLDAVDGLEKAKLDVSGAKADLDKKRSASAVADEIAAQKAGAADEATARQDAATKRKAVEAAAQVQTEKESALAVLESKSFTFEEAKVDFGQETWWAVADTIAYAVMREAGNTAIAGAGIFVDPLTVAKGFSDLFFKWNMPTTGRLQPIVDYSFVVHLLPPAEAQSAADIGIAPLGIGLFGRRVVMGVGWNISRQGMRPDSHNRYVYVGISASELLTPKPPSP